jgi:hypothetical protein
VPTASSGVNLGVTACVRLIPDRRDDARLAVTADRRRRSPLRRLGRLLVSRQTLGDYSGPRYLQRRQSEGRSVRIPVTQPRKKPCVFNNFQPRVILTIELRNRGGSIRRTSHRVKLQGSAAQR